MIQLREYQQTAVSEIRTALAKYLRAKRYWSMDTGTLDKIQEGEIKDIEIEED